MPKRLAEIIVDSTLATREDVVRAAHTADEENVPLVVALVRQIGIDELSLVSMIKRHVRVPVADPAIDTHDPDAIRELSRDTCWRLRVLPLSVTYTSTDAKILHIAMADPTDAVAMAEIEHLTGSQVEPLLMPLSAIEELVDKVYKAFVTEVMPSRLRKPFGGDLEVSTQPMAGADHGAPVEPRTKPSTVPFHRVADEANMELRFQALLELLVEKQVLGREEFQERVRSLMKERDEDG